MESKQKARAEKFIKEIIADLKLKLSIIQFQKQQTLSKIEHFKEKLENL